MNLIEQLGGYGEAKGLFNLYEYSISFRYYKDFEGDFESAGYVDVFIPDLQKALLEYRRQHNIFEVGDRVVIESYRNTCISCGRPSQYGIGDLMVIHNLDGNVISDDDYNFIDYRDVRHATDAEIKAGKRLGVNQ